MNNIMEAVCGVCVKIRNEKHSGSLQQMLTVIRRHFRVNGFDIKFKSKRHKELEVDEFYVNAYYDPFDDSNMDTPIEVVIHHNFANVQWDKTSTTRLLIQLFDAIVHEFKHQRQSRKRHFKQFWFDTSYLEDPDEIDAYSISIAIELCRSMGKYRALRYMPHFSSLARLKLNQMYVSPTLTDYVSNFGSVDHPVIQLLAKKIYIRLQKLDTDCIFM